MNIRLAALTQGENEPSARFRVRKIIPQLEKRGVVVNEFYSKYSAYPPSGTINRMRWLPLTVFDSYKRALMSNQYDLCLLQRPLVSTLFTCEPLIKVPYIFDVDDAIFLHKRSFSVDLISRRAAHIICGNSFLADYFSKFSSVSILPTAVDTTYFVPSTDKVTKEGIIGWSGSSSGFKYLYQIEDALSIVLNVVKNSKIKIVSNCEPHFTKIPKNRVIFEKWSASTEVKAIQSFTIGIMPLDDSLWSRGKCSYKMLTYMACEIPVVVSNVGMNEDVLKLGKAGFSASDTSSWVESLITLLSESNNRCLMGKEGRKVVENNYSNEVVVPKLVEVFNKVI